MRISARCDYACKALLELSIHWPKKEPLQINRISENQDIPMRYLVHILIQLKRMGFVSSVRGRDGGYNLTKSPEDIALGEVIRNVQGPLLPLTDSAKKNGSVFVTIWNDLEGVMANVLDKITFNDILDKVKGLDKTTVYHI